MQPISLLESTVALATTGEKNAMHWLYQNYSKSMYNTCLRIVKDHHDAEDIIQESFIMALKKLGQLKNRNHFPAWLKKIVINQSLKHLKGRINWFEIENEADEMIDEAAPTAISSIPMNAINEAITRLPNGSRQVFVLFLLEDYSHKEIAESLNISESTSKSQYHRAKKLLQIELKRYRYVG